LEITYIMAPYLLSWEVVTLLKQCFLKAYNKACFRPEAGLFSQAQEPWQTGFALWKAPGNSNSSKNG